MYENKYNYVDVAEPAKSGHTAKTVALFLAVVMAGGVSGYGGAYLANRNNTAAITETVDDDTSAIQTTAAENNDDSEAEAVTTTSSAVDNDASVSSLLGSNSKSNGELTTEEIVNKVSPSVVSVQSTFASGTSTGTGIIMSSDGYIITNAHVVQNEETQYVNNGGGNDYDYFDPYGFFGGFFGNQGSYEEITVNADEVKIYLSDDEGTEYTATIVGADKDSDLAVLKIEANDLTAAEFGNSDELAMGKRAIAIGYPMGLGLSVSEGVISGLNRELSVELSSGGSASMTLIQTDAAINPGNSGGPLINEFGQVVGITSSKLASTQLEGLGFAIPISDAMPLLNDLMTKGYVTNHTPQIGITGSNITSAIRRYYGLPVTSGVMVVSVTEGSGADKAGICEGDVIIAADGQEITSMAELTEIKDEKEIGDTITLTLARNNGSEDVVVTLGEAVENETDESSSEQDEDTVTTTTPENNFFGRIY